jgi:hypothetical protein
VVRRVEVVILHPGIDDAADPLERAVDAARRDLAERHRDGFLKAGADDASVVSGAAGGGANAVPFGARLRDLASGLGDGGLVILGSGAVPLATAADRRAFVAAAAGETPGALANNRYSADIVAIARAREALTGIPDLATDNALPRWLEEVRAVPVRDLRGRWRLGVDIDGPLDLVLLGRRWAAHLPVSDRTTATDRIAAIRAVAADPRAELVVAGRTSPSSLAWLEAHTAARTRALVEERGLRTSVAGQRPPSSVLGGLLDHEGPEALGAVLSALGEAALVDTRVLLAHRLGPDDRAWPPAADRFASDLLLADHVHDPWLRALTASAAAAPIPVLLGGHTLVGPGVRLVIAGPR